MNNPSEDYLNWDPPRYNSPWFDSLWPDSRGDDWSRLIEKTRRAQEPEPEPIWTPECEDPCGERFLDFMGAIAEMTEPTKEAVMEQIKKLVLELNALHDQSGGSLIDAEQSRSLKWKIQLMAECFDLQHDSDELIAQWCKW